MVRIKMGGYVDDDGKIMTKEELNDWILEIQAENARFKKALEFYADPNSWIDESVTYVYSVIQYDDQDIPPEEHRLCDKHGGRRAREALKGGE